MCLLTKPSKMIHYKRKVYSVSMILKRVIFLSALVFMTIFCRKYTDSNAYIVDGIIEAIKKEDINLFAELSSNAELYLELERLGLSSMETSNMGLAGVSENNYIYLVKSVKSLNRSINLNIDTYLSINIVERKLTDVSYKIYYKFARTPGKTLPENILDLIIGDFDRSFYYEEEYNAFFTGIYKSFIYSREPKLKKKIDEVMYILYSQGAESYSIFYTSPSSSRIIAVSKNVEYTLSLERPVHRWVITSVSEKRL